jgi:hypothetical protein
MHLLLTEPLSPDNEQAKRQMIEAIRECHLFISNYRRGDARGFSFYAENAGRFAGAGDSISLKGEVRMHVRTPRECKIRLLRDGNLTLEKKGISLEYSTRQPGNYRVEAYRGKKGWIFSNHIRVVT